MQAITEVPELGAAHAAARNRDIFPNVISEIQSSFGQAEVSVFIYNIGPQEFSTPRPPNHPHLLIRRCPADKEWALVGQIAHPFKEVEFDTNGKQRINLTDGYKEATRMLNPWNPGIDQDFDSSTALNVNGNLNQFGVFWSTHYPPLPEELAAAKRRMEATYRRTIQELDDAAVDTDPAALRARVDRTARAACEYFGEVRSWYPNFIPKQTTKSQVECPNCGERIRANAPYHAIGAAVCVLDWRKAVEHGVKQLRDVPPAHKWND